MRRINTQVYIGGIALVCCIAAIALTIQLYNLGNHPVIATMPAMLPSPTPSATPLPVPKTSISTQISPDGSVDLILKTKEVPPNQTQYILSVENKQKAKEIEIARYSFINTEKIILPFNAWSPDNKYFFVQQTSNATDTYLVFSATEKESTEKPHIDVGAYFLEKEVPGKLDQVIGWAAPYLLIVTTIQEDQTKGPSYWFDTTSNSFLRLSHAF